MVVKHRRGVRDVFTGERLARLASSFLAMNSKNLRPRTTSRTDKKRIKAKTAPREAAQPANPPCRAAIIVARTRWPAFWGPLHSVDDIEADIQQSDMIAFPPFIDLLRRKIRRGTADLAPPGPQRGGREVGYCIRPRKEYQRSPPELRLPLRITDS
jgi:hypothetical protein